MNRVTFGQYNFPNDYSGRTIAKLRADLMQTTGNTPGADAFVNGQKVSDTYLIAPGDNIVFHKNSGTKAC